MDHDATDVLAAYFAAGWSRIGLGGGCYGLARYVSGSRYLLLTADDTGIPRSWDDSVIVSVWTWDDTDDPIEVSEAEAAGTARDYLARLI